MVGGGMTDGRRGRDGKHAEAAYLQTQTTAVDSDVIGMSTVEEGEIRLPPDDPGEWPYDRRR